MSVIKPSEMTKTKMSINLLTIIASVILLVAGGCKKDTPAQNTTYRLMVKDILGITGTVTFTETGSNAATIDIALANAPSGIHPANLYGNSAVEGGPVVIMLNPVDATGKSSTAVTTMTYAELIAFNGFIKVLKSSNEPDVILAQGDIGGNMITSFNKKFALNIIGAFAVSGTALFEKRINGNTLITISITGTIADEVYPATINLGSIASVGGGPVVKLLNNVDGTIGKSYTNIQKLDSGIVITYDNWLVYDGYINIYQTSIALSNIICHGNIGSN
jgi:hypothetical protein